jgi:endonuclease-3
VQISKLVTKVINNLNKVFITFKRYYVLVPLEVFGSDPYKTLISTLLSARTRDEVTLKVSLELFKIAPTLNTLKKLKENEIEKIIHPVGFYKTKAKHLYELARIINKVPYTRDELMALPGVGRKTANLVLNRAFHIPAIAVDTHVHRISNLLGWVKTKTPEETERELNKIIPKNYWPDMNKLFVSIGRQYRSERQLKEFLKKEKLLL